MIYEIRSIFVLGQKEGSHYFARFLNVHDSVKVLGWVVWTRV